MNTVGLGSSGRVEEQFQAVNERLRSMDHRAESGFRNMLEAINSVSAGYPTRKIEGTVLTAYSNDKAEVWRQFRKELLSDGFTSASIERHKHALRAYVHYLDDQGLLDEAGPDEGLLPQQDSGNLVNENIDETNSEGLLGEKGNAEGSRPQKMSATTSFSIAETESVKELAADRTNSNTDDGPLCIAGQDCESDDKLAEVPPPNYLLPYGLWTTSSTALYAGPSDASHSSSRCSWC